MSNETAEFSFSKDSIIIYKLGRIESALADIQIQQALNAKCYEAIAERVRKIESKLAYGTGLIAGISAIITLVINFLIKKVLG